MDFSRVGVVEADGAAYCTHVQPRFGRKTRHIRGPFRRDQQAAQVDLDSMRAAARGMSREDGFAAIGVEADALKAGKPPKEAGYIDRDGKAFRALVQFRHEGTLQHIPGPWRPNEKAAKADLESMRAAASGMGREDSFAAMAVEADALKAGKPPKEVGFIEPAGGSFRARVRFKEEGILRHIPGPWRPDEEAAKSDLASMRAAASGMSREDDFAAMAAEDKRLIASKAPKVEGSVDPMGTHFRAIIRWRVEGRVIPARGRRRTERRRAEEDLECMREASSGHEDVLASRKAVDAEVRRLQQQAEEVSAHDDALTRKEAIAAKARRLQQQAETERPRRPPHGVKTAPKAPKTEARQPKVVPKGPPTKPIHSK